MLGAEPAAASAPGVLAQLRALPAERPPSGGAGTADAKRPADKAAIAGPGPGPEFDASNGRNSVERLARLERPAAPFSLPQMVARKELAIASSWRNRRSFIARTSV